MCYLLIAASILGVRYRILEYPELDLNPHCPCFSWYTAAGYHPIGDKHTMTPPQGEENVKCCSKKINKNNDKNKNINF